MHPEALPAWAVETWTNHRSAPSCPHLYSPYDDVSIATGADIRVDDQGTFYPGDLWTICPVLDRGCANSKARLSAS